MVRTILIIMNRGDQMLWAAAVNTVFHVNLSYLWVFSSRSFAMKPYNKRKRKLGTKAEEGTLVGYFRGNAYLELHIDGLTTVENKFLSFWKIKCKQL